MKTLKRILCLLLVLCLCAGLFAGCSKDTGRTPPELHVYDVKDVDTGIEELVDNFSEITVAGDRLYAVGYDYDEEYNETSFLLSVKLDGTDVQKHPLEMREHDVVRRIDAVMHVGAFIAADLQAVDEAVGIDADFVYDAVGNFAAHAFLFLHLLRQRAEQAVVCAQAGGIGADREEQVVIHVHMFAGKTHMLGQHIDQPVFALRQGSDRADIHFLRLGVQRALEVLHAGKIAEDRLGGAAQRLGHGTGVNRFHAFA